MKTLPIQMPNSLHAQARRVANELGTSISQLIREGLADRIRAHEAQKQSDVERRRRNREVSGERLKESIRDMQPVTTAIENSDGCDAIFAEAAVQWVDAMRRDDQRAMRRIRDGLPQAIKRVAGLTGPWNNQLEIERRLALAVKRCEASAPARVVEPSDDEVITVRGDG
jgi:hypothetical protein